MSETGKPIVARQWVVGAPGSTAPKPRLRRGALMIAKPKPARRSGKTIFTEVGVKRMKPPPSGQFDQFEKLKRGLTLVLRLSYGGTKAWRVLYYTDGAPHAKTLGHYPELGVAAARKKAEAYWSSHRHEHIRGRCG